MLAVAYINLLRLHSHDASFRPQRKKFMSVKSMQWKSSHERAAMKSPFFLSSGISFWGCDERVNAITEKKVG